VTVTVNEKEYPLLELEVKVININEGKNNGIVSRCKELSEYSTFIAKAYTFLKELDDKEKAIDEAVKFCQKHGILKEFLEHKASEVLNMLLTEWNMEDAIAVAREEAREDALEEYREIIADKDAKIADKDAKIADKDAKLADDAAEIASLRSQIAKLQNKNL